MSYRGVGSYYEIPQPYAGMGSYYTFSPHEVIAGFGSVSAEFNANQVWADVQKGGSCYAPGAKPTASEKAACNAAGARATNMIRAALNELGYGPLAVGNMPWSNANPGAAWKRFLSDHNLAPGPGLGVSLQGLLLMEKLLKEGKSPGPNKPVEFEKVNGEFVPKTKGGLLAEAGLTGGSLLLAALVVGGVGYAAWQAGKKKKKKGARGRTMRM